MKKENLKNLINNLKLNYVDLDIIEKNFPDDGRRGKVEIIDFKRDITSEEAIEEMDKKGYRPATAYELLTWAKDNWNGKGWIVELDSKWRSPYGNLNVLFLWSYAGDRELDLHFFAYGWPRHFRFAFVRKESSELKPLKTLPDTLIIDGFEYRKVKI